MNLSLTIVIVLVAVAVSIGLFLVIRRFSPAGGFFNDGDRAAGVFGVLATGFSVLLGFVVFLAFTTYDTALSGAQSEASDVIQQYQTAQLLPQPQSGAALRRADLLRTGHREHRMAGLARRPAPAAEPVGRRALPDVHEGRSEDGRPAGRLLEVARPDLRIASPTGSTASRPETARSRDRSG